MAILTSMKIRIFGPGVPKYPHIDPQVREELMKMVALAPTVPLFS